MKIARPTLCGLVALQLLAIAWPATPASALLAQQRAQGDFNGDGFDDLAIGVLGEDDGAGAVNVLYGTALGLAATNNQIWRQGSGGIVGGPEPGDQFGQVLATGDFNGDGYGDLAVGVPGEGEGGVFQSVGGVNVIYGSATGLTGAGNQFWNQDSPNILGVNEGADGTASNYGENFGAALAVGDFNDDGFSDLAVGVPGETTILLNFLSFVGAFSGSVNVIYGSASGLTADGNQFWNQSLGLEGTSEPFDAFGSSLAAADFDGDGFDDLAVGVPGENTGGRDAGAVNVIRGGVNGLTEIGNQFWSQDSTGIAGTSDAEDKFGYSVAAGNFNGDGFFDLAIGIPGQDVSGHEKAGAVAVLFGRAGGLSSTNNQLWNQDFVSPSTGVALADTAEDFDLFGSNVAAGDFNGDGRDDLAIAAYIEDIGIQNGVGAVHILYGGGTVLAPQGNQFWHQNVFNIEGTTEERDNFGTGIAPGDFNDDGYVDLAIGVPGDGSDDAGGVNVIYGTAGGLDAANDQLWSQDSPGILDSREQSDLFGYAVAGSSTTGGGAGVSGEFAELVQDCKKEGAKQHCRVEGVLMAFNPGTFAAGNSLTRFFLSSDAVFDAGDELVGEEKVPSLEPDESVEVAFKLKLPKGRNATGEFLIAVMDADDQVPEVNENNNVVVSGEIE